jgi:amino acid transporter
MAASTLEIEPVGRGEAADKGLKSGALSLVASIVIGVASTAPAYSLAATLGFVVAFVGLQSPAIAVLAFIPMLFVSIGYAELNKAEPDCGTTFTWATKAFGPKTGWLGGWGILASDILVMASLAQVAGQYCFLLVGADGIGSNATSPWVLLVGVLWIVVMAAICYAGIEISANFQKALLAIELSMLALFSVVALVRVYSGHHPAQSIHPAASWFNPLHLSFSHLMAGILLFLFIYWGWDTTVTVNEESANARRNPGRGAVIATLVLLATYAVATTAAQAFAGIGAKGIGLGNADNQNDVISVLGKAVFGGGGVGTFLSRLLILMVLTSAAASTQTTILPTARTSLAMAAYRSIPRAFARIHPRFRTPTVSTIAIGLAAIAFYVPLNFVSGGNVIADSVTALGFMVAFYYGLTGFTCVWYYRKVLGRSQRDLWLRGIIPGLGGAILFAVLGYSIWFYWDPTQSYTSWLMQFSPHWHVAGVEIIGIFSFVLGLVLLAACMAVYREFFTGRVLAPAAEVAEFVREGEQIVLPDSEAARRSGHIVMPDAKTADRGDAGRGHETVS